MIKLTSETISFIILLLAILATPFGFSLIYRSILLELKESKKLKYRSKTATIFLACSVIIISVSCFHIFSNSNLFYTYLPVSIIAFILPDLRYRREKIEKMVI